MSSLAGVRTRLINSRPHENPPPTGTRLQEEMEEMTGQIRKWLNELRQKKKDALKAIEDI